MPLPILSYNIFFTSINSGHSEKSENYSLFPRWATDKGTDEQFLGEIRLKDVLRLRKEGARDISSIVMKEVPSVLESMTVEDMLPLLPKVQQALPVVDENNRLKGVVSTSAIIIEMTGKDQKEIEEIIQNAIDL